MNYLLILVLLLQAIPGIADICKDGATINSGDSFKSSAAIYIVCPSLQEGGDTEIIKYVNNLAKQYSNLAPEIFIQFLDNEKQIGYLEKAPYKIPESELVADFYSGTGKLYFWPGTSKERFLITYGLKH
ncbi:hypothetical protein [Microbulbifer aestuariivivens]|uniref:hypothetical protein n=1 Tax=Microbulbifer aestuariivivens TaxID=1908308 RepID=UPI0031EB73C9